MMYVSFIIPFVFAYIWYAWKAINKRKITSEEMNEEGLFIKGDRLQAAGGRKQEEAMKTGTGHDFRNSLFYCKRNQRSCKIQWYHQGCSTKTKDRKGGNNHDNHNVSSFISTEPQVRGFE